MRGWWPVQALTHTYHTKIYYELVLMGYPCVNSQLTHIPPMNTRSITIEEIDELFLAWHDHINASALFRRALTDEMAVRDVDRAEFRECFERAREHGYTYDEIVAETNRFADLASLVAADSRHQPPDEPADG